ncbi:hypothetical protein [Nonomuraea sp. NPDC052265]|uniref:hypothetical protein n=1 Tax=Nonomuraea sp. NPDC052265 TaxID=3364374 RepID=UPI0037CAA9D3
MRALVAHAYEPLEHLSFEDVPVLAPGPRQILVRTEGAALNPVDVKLETGAMRDTMPVTHLFVRQGVRRDWMFGMRQVCRPAR